MNLIYLDHSATSFPKPETVYRKMDEFYRRYGANPGRSGHKMGVRAREAVESVRLGLSRLFNAEGPEQVVFTLNATDALNMAIAGVLSGAARGADKGAEVVTTVLEHNSVSRPLNYLERDGAVRVIRLTPEDGAVSAGAVKKAVTEKTRLVAVTHASNVTGWEQPVGEIGRWVREHSGAYFLVDAAQSAGILPIDVRGMAIDLLAFTGHKGLLGPMGTGGLYVSPRVKIRPYRSGGSGTDSASELQPDEMPDLLEAGTGNLPGIVGLGEGVKFVMETGAGKIHERETALKRKLLGALAGVRGLSVYSPAEGNGPAIVSFNIAGLSPDTVAAILDGEFDIAVRAGLHCAPYLHRFLGTWPEGTVRISLGYSNTEEEILTAAGAVKTIAENTGA